MKEIMWCLSQKDLICLTGLSLIAPISKLHNLILYS